MASPGLRRGSLARISWPLCPRSQQHPGRTQDVCRGQKSVAIHNARDENPFAVAWPEIKQPVPAAEILTPSRWRREFSDFIWVGYTSDGSVSFTTGVETTATPSWSPGDPNHMLPRRICTRITIGQAPDTNHPQIAVDRTVYVTFGGFFPSSLDTRGNVWKTQNNGQTWEPIHHNLPSTPIFSLVISPANPNFLYIGTEVGVFASSDGGDHWSPAFAGSSADTLVYSLVVSASSPSTPDIIYAGTEDGVFASKDDGETWSPGFGWRTGQYSCRRAFLDGYAADQETGRGYSWPRDVHPRRQRLSAECGEARFSK